MMPEMNVLEFLSTMRANPDWNGIPVIMATSVADVQTIKQAFEAGCHYYVIKPIKAVELLQKVWETLQDSARTLRDKSQVMLEIGFDFDAYDEVAQAFAMHVRDTIAQLGRPAETGVAEDMVIALRDLGEGATLLGAEKVMKILDRCVMAHGQTLQDIERADYAELLLELTLVTWKVYEHLCRLADSLSGSAAATTPRRGAHRHAYFRWSDGCQPGLWDLQ